MSAPRNRIRREDILTVAAELFAAKGVAPTTVRDLGAAAGVHSGSLYHYFDSKDAIAVELLTAFVIGLDERFTAIATRPAPPLPRLRALIESTLAFIDANPQTTRIFLTDYRYLHDRGLLDELHPRRRALRAHWVRVIDEGKADGSLRTDLPSDVVSRVIRDALWATGSWPAGSRPDPQTLSRHLIELFVHGLHG